ncbi:MAG: sugar phosphate nucleotidyltransferase [Vulcanimicrobiaceae bacterium]
MLLAGGMSTRLYPLTRQVPKPLVPIAGEPISAQILRYLRSYGIEDVAINIHYHADQIREAFGDGSRYGVRLHYLEEPKLMGSAGAVKQMESFFRDGTFIVIGCDILTNVNLTDLIAFHRKNGALASMALSHMEDVEQYGVVIAGDDGRIIDFQEKPKKDTERSHEVNTGIYCFEPGIFDRIAGGAFVDFGKDVFPALQREKAAFYALPMPNAYWCDIGTPREYRRATNDVLAGRVGLRSSNGVGHIPSDTRIGQSVQIDGNVHIGIGVQIGDRVRVVGPSVIGDRARIAADASIERSILWDDVVVGSGAHLDGAIVGNGYAIANGASINGAIVANGDSSA